jgi:hypothetical protein
MLTTERDHVLHPPLRPTTISEKVDSIVTVSTGCGWPVHQTTVASSVAQGQILVLGAGELRIEAAQGPEVASAHRHVAGSTHDTFLEGTPDGRVPRILECLAKPTKRRFQRRFWERQRTRHYRAGPLFMRHVMLVEELLIDRYIVVHEDKQLPPG